VKLPLLDLNIKQTEMSDLGFKQLLQRFESMHQTIQKSNLQIEQQMTFDISNNQLTDSSLVVFADLLSKFAGFFRVEMRSMMRMRSQTISEIAGALSVSNIGFLDLRGNYIEEENLNELLSSLEENWVL
jgi:hypothetical protein